jgi:hypothetical protein
MTQQSRVGTEPRAGRPVMPNGYGVPETDEGLLPWSHVVERMERSLHFWIATTRADGRPHVTPIWGMWFNGTLYFDGSPETQRGRNIAANPNISVNLEDGKEAVILEGAVEMINGRDRSFSEPLAAAYAAKYKDYGYAPEPNTWDEGGLYILHIRKAFAWTDFPKDVTRWRF